MVNFIIRSDNMIISDRMQLIRTANVKIAITIDQLVSIS